MHFHDVVEVESCTHLRNAPPFVFAIVVCLHSPWLAFPPVLSPVEPSFATLGFEPESLGFETATVESLIQLSVATQESML
jgi:hypothetical protein